VSPSSVYLDASALVKLVVDEHESIAVRSFIEGWPSLLTSRIAVVEVARAVARRGAPAELTTAALIPVVVVDVTEAIVARASAVGPPGLRTLDAIHLASALELGEDLAALVTYDGRLAEAARALGVPVVAPG